MAHALPTVHINGKTYFIDERLRELRNVENPHDAKRFSDENSLRAYLYWTCQLQFIVGQTVIAAEMEFDEDFEDWAPVICFSNGERIRLLSEEEGNNPGRFQFLSKGS